MRAHRKLKTWQLGRAYAGTIYDITATFPATETYGLVTQLRRAAVSVPSNIAEGNGQRTTKSYVKYLYHARGSIREIDTHLAIAHDQGLLNSTQIDYLSTDLNELAAKLQAQINSLENQTPDR